MPQLEHHADPAWREQAPLIQQFVRENSQNLRALAARLVGRNDCDDVAQEALVSLMMWIRSRPPPETMQVLRSPTDLRRLMYTITARRAYDCLRRRQRDKVTLDGGEVARAEAQTHVGFDLMWLDRAYAALSPMQRIAHILHHYYGFTDAELGQTLGTTKLNSRTLIARATRALKRAMEMKA